MSQACRPPRGRRTPRSRSSPREVGATASAASGQLCEDVRTQPTTRSALTNRSEPTLASVRSQGRLLRRWCPWRTLGVAEAVAAGMMTIFLCVSVLGECATAGPVQSGAGPRQQYIHAVMSTAVCVECVWFRLALLLGQFRTEEDQTGRPLLIAFDYLTFVMPFNYGQGYLQDLAVDCGARDPRESGAVFYVVAFIAVPVMVVASSFATAATRGESFNSCCDDLCTGERLKGWIGISVLFLVVPIFLSFWADWFPYQVLLLGLNFGRYSEMMLTGQVSVVMLAGLNIEFALASVSKAALFLRNVRSFCERSPSWSPGSSPRSETRDVELPEPENNRRTSSPRSAVGTRKAAPLLLGMPQSGAKICVLGASQAPPPPSPV